MGSSLRMGQEKRIEPEREVETLPPAVEPMPERRRKIFPEPHPMPVPPKNVAF